MAQGCRCVLLFAVVVAVVLESAEAAEYIVGDGAGWTKEGAPDRYVKWAAGKNFVLGDVLVFNFKETPVVMDGSDVTDRTQQVREVEKETYEACEQKRGFLTDSEQLQFYKTSPAKVTLNRTGEYYFACLWSDHCKKGQKIAIKVSATKAPASSGSSPAPATNAPAPKASTPATNAPAPAAKTDAPAPSKKETAPASNAPASSKSAPSPSPKGDAPATKEEAPATDMSPPATKAAEPTPAAPANAPSSSTTAVFASAFVTLSSIVMGFIL